jgi:hypothetical protein
VAVELNVFPAQQTDYLVDLVELEMEIAAQVEQELQIKVMQVAVDFRVH